MQVASDALAFERAAELRDRLQAIERTLDRQEVHSYKGDDFDVLAAAVAEGDAVVQVFRVRDGTIVSRDHFALEGSEGAAPPEVLASFLRQHYAIAAAVPPEIVVPVPLPDAGESALPALHSVRAPALCPETARRPRIPIVPALRLGRWILASAYRPPMAESR